MDKYQSLLSIDLFFLQDPGLLFMLMFSDHIVGQQMCAGRKNGFFYLLLNVILYLTGKTRTHWDIE